MMAATFAAALDAGCGGVAWAKAMTGRQTTTKRNIDLEALINAPFTMTPIEVRSQ